MKLLVALLKQNNELLKCGKLGNSKNRPYCSIWCTRNYQR